MTGDADLKLFGFSLWVLGRQFAESKDYWDGNWLNVRARVEVPGARVEHAGHFVRAEEIQEFCRQVSVLDKVLTGEAALSCIEPWLKIVIRLTGGKGEMTVAITPDHIMQSHKFMFSMDQSYLKPLLADCRIIMSKWPAISKPS